MTRNEWRIINWVWAVAMTLIGSGLLLYPIFFYGAEYSDRARHCFVTGSGQLTVYRGFRHLGLAEKPACRLCQLRDGDIRFPGNFIYFGR